jgi:hypothetical protein
MRNGPIDRHSQPGVQGRIGAALLREQRGRPKHVNERAHRQGREQCENEKQIDLLRAFVSSWLHLF